MIPNPDSRAAYCEPSTDPTDIDMDKSNEEEKRPLRDGGLTE